MESTCFHDQSASNSSMVEKSESQTKTEDDMVLHSLGSDVDYMESKECMCFLRNLNQIGRSARTHQIQGCLLGTYQKRLE